MLQAQRIFTLVITSIETILVGGTIYGWSYMQNALIEEGFFEHGNSTFQIERLNLVVTISTTVGTLLSFLFGHMIDAKGLWFSRTVILAIVAIAYVLFAMSSTFNDNIIFFGATALVTGNLGIWTTNLQIGNLFPGYQSFYGYLINGCGISSYFVFFIFNNLYFQFGLSFELIFCLAAALTLLSHIHTFVLIPSDCVKKSIPKTFKYGYKELRCFKLNIANKDLDSEENNNAIGVTKVICNETKPDHKTFGLDIDEKRKTIDCLKSKKYITFVARYSYNRLSIAFFFWGNLQNWVDSVTGEDKVVSQHLLFFYSIVILSAVVVSPLIGLGLDKLKAKFSAESNIKNAENKINSLSDVLIDLFLLMFYISACIPLKPFFYLTFCFSLFHICILYGNMSCFLSSQFPAKNFGKLYTVAMGVSSIVSLLQFPATILTVRVAGFFNVCLFFVGVTFVVLLFSIRKLTFVFKNDLQSGSSKNFQVNSAYVADFI